MPACLPAPCALACPARILVQSALTTALCSSAGTRIRTHVLCFGSSLAAGLPCLSALEVTGPRAPRCRYHALLEPERDTKVLLAWSTRGARNRVVVAFRGTISMANIRTDMEVGAAFRV